MTDDVTRIGRGVPTPPTAPARRSPRRNTALLIAAGVVIGLGIAALLLGPRLIGRQPVAMPTQPSPTLKMLDEQETCVLVVPVARDSAQLVLDVIEKPDAVDWSKVQRTHDFLELIAEAAAPTMRDDINQQKAMLAQLISLSRTGGKMTFEMNDFKASGLRIGARCMKYAS